MDLTNCLSKEQPWSSSINSKCQTVQNSSQDTTTTSNTSSPTRFARAPLKPMPSNDTEVICRICLDNGAECLVAPCKCAGSAKYAHESCLLQWFFRTRRRKCELCLSDVNVKPVGFKPLAKWRLPSESCDFVFYLFTLYCLIMFVFTGMIVWIASQGCISPVCITLYVICGMSLCYFVYCCGCVEYSKTYWRACLTTNRNWRIYNREECQKQKLSKGVYKSNFQYTTSDESTRPNPALVATLSIGLDATTNQPRPSCSSCGSTILNIPENYYRNTSSPCPNSDQNTTPIRTLGSTAEERSAQEVTSKEDFVNSGSVTLLTETAANNSESSCDKSKSDGLLKQFERRKEEKEKNSRHERSSSSPPIFTINIQEKDSTRTLRIFPNLAFDDTKL